MMMGVLSHVCEYTNILWSIRRFDLSLCQLLPVHVFEERLCLDLIHPCLWVTPQSLTGILCQELHGRERERERAECGMVGFPFSCLENVQHSWRVST